MIKKWNVLIVEDENISRQILKNILLTRYDNIDVIGEAENVQQAIALFNAHPEIEGVFMDIQLEENNLRAGLDLAANWKKKNKAIWFIFTTAFIYHSPEASNNIHPEGYLLKPIDIDELDNVLDYINQQPRQPAKSMFVVESAIEILHKVVNIEGKKEKVIEFIKPTDILYVRKNKNAASVQIKLVSGKILEDISGSLESWQEKLNYIYFQAIHRSYFVNLEYAQSIHHPHPFQKETYQLAFTCCTERLTIGEVFYQPLINRLQNRNQT